MSLFEFTPPTVPELAWDQSSPLFRHYGTLPVGRTIYKDALGNWHILDEGYEPEVLVGALETFFGGREYFVTEGQYFELYQAGFIPSAQLGFFPGRHPGPITFPVTDPPVEPVGPPPDGSFVFYPGEDVYPGEDLYPEAD